jgi:7-carboxy-7-deazaguanine synthase (Cx14CxxC type)
MSYQVKEIYYTLQGEGANVGRPAVFCRFAKCNLWTGRAEDREQAFCKLCDTDFVGTDGPGGGVFADADALADAVAGCGGVAAPSGVRRWVVCTGGEPLLQLDAPLIDALHRRGFVVAIESNGTLPAPDGIDWICVSPKPGPKLRQCAGQELKLAYPQAGLAPEAFESLPFEHFFLQPIDGPDREHNTHSAVQYCLLHPRWRLSVQVHKLIGIA